MRSASRNSVEPRRLRSRGRAWARAYWKSWSRTTGTRIELYTVRFEKAVHVLHAFQKKSPSVSEPRSGMLILSPND